MINTGVIQTTTVKGKPWQTRGAWTLCWAKISNRKDNPALASLTLHFQSIIFWEEKKKLRETQRVLSTGTKHTQRDLNLKTCKRAIKKEWKIQLKLPIYLGWHIHVTHLLNFQVSVICASIFFLKKRIDTNAVLCFGKWRRRRRVTKWFTSFGHVADYQSDGNIHLSPDS